MSFIQSSVALFFMITMVLYVSYTPTESAVVTGSTRFGKGNNTNSIISSAVLHRVKMNNIDGIQMNARVKKTTDQAQAAAKMPPMKLLGLMMLVFSNMFSKKPIDGDPPLSPKAAVEPLVKMSRHGLDVLKENVGHKQKS